MTSNSRRGTTLHLAVTSSFVALAAVAAFATGWLATFDGPASDAVRGGSLTSFFREVSMLGATEVAVVLSVAVVALLWRRDRWLAVLYPAAVLVGAVVNVGLKVLIDRPRPLDPETATALASFPSGHTFQAAVVLGLLPLVLDRAVGRRWITTSARVIAVVAVAAVALSRVYLGAHWVSDVVGGALVGTVVVLAVHRLLAAVDVRRDAGQDPALASAAS